jgi:hypothetical protein
MKRDSVFLLISRTPPAADAWPLSCIARWRRFCGLAALTARDEHGAHHAARARPDAWCDEHRVKVKGTRPVLRVMPPPSGAGKVYM